jgi:hypothetical protein
LYDTSQFKLFIIFQKLEEFMGAEMSHHPELKPGTIVQFKNLITEAELNDQYGVIKKRTSENSYRIMLGINTKNDMSIKTKNFITQIQCLNERRSNFTGLVVWPELVGFEYPVVQWLDWPHARRNLKLWVDELYADRWGLFRRNKPAVYDLRKKEEMLEHLHDYLGWNGVANRSNITIRESPSDIYKIYYEVYHVGKINKWYKQTFDKFVVSTGNTPKTFRGPFIIMQNMHDDAIENQVSLNYHKANISTMKHFYETYDEKTGKMMSFEDFSEMMTEKLKSLYNECQIPSCDCESKSVMVFEKRIKNQYDLLSKPLTKDSSGELPEYGRMTFDHVKKRVKLKKGEDASGKNQYTKIPFNLMDLKINEGYDGLESD